MSTSEDPRLESLLRAAGREERTTLSAAELLSDAPGAELVARIVEEQRARRRSRSRWFALLGAAALVLALFAARSFLQPAEDPPSHNLGAGLISLRAPVGPVSDLGSFAWDAEGAAWFEVVVEREDRTPLARSGRVDGHSWSPESREVSSWPNRIRWEVRAFDASGALLDAESASAWR